MLMEPLRVSVLDVAKKYLASLPEEERALITAGISKIQVGDFSAAHTKQLRGAVREFIVGYHRILYFVIDNRLCVVSGFRKKTNKTPKKEIGYAEKIYKLLKQ